MASTPAPEPYRSTPVFDEVTLPAALRREHRTKPGVWGVVRVLEGQVELSYANPPRTLILSSDLPGLLLPEQPHFVEPIGAMRMRVEFYDQSPEV